MQINNHLLIRSHQNEYLIHYRASLYPKLRIYHKKEVDILR